MLDGFGRAVRSASRYAVPRTVAELPDLLAGARADGLAVSFRGAGRSYGDASLNQNGLAIDTTALDRVIAWDPDTGIVEVEPGVTIEGLWRRTLADGWWPPVVPGTMAPTIGGCLAMNVHGKNNFRVGSFGEHVLDFDLLTSAGDLLRCGRDQNADLFHAAVGGIGLFGAFTRIRLQLKRVGSGKLRVRAIPTRTLDEMFDRFEERRAGADYLVGWIDCAVGGRGLGRGMVHQANHLRFDEDPDGEASLEAKSQELPTSIFGVPKSVLWRCMGPFMNNTGVRLVNAAKYTSGAARGEISYLQSHVAFAFLLDYVPNWRLAYGPSGFIQYQAFAPDGAARDVFRRILEVSQRRGLPAYLGVVKRHRPDPFWLTPGLDGWSLALDYSARERQRLWELTEELSEIVLAAGGKFFFAKDLVMRPADAERAWGRETLDRFFALKHRVDPAGLFSTDLARRVFPTRLAAEGAVRVA